MSAWYDDGEGRLREEPTLFRDVCRNCGDDYRMGAVNDDGWCDTCSEATEAAIQNSPARSEARLEVQVGLLVEMLDRYRAEGREASWVGMFETRLADAREALLIQRGLRA